jgi:hypothetical protein
LILEQVPRLARGSSKNDVGGLFGRENVGVDDNVVVRRQLFLNLVEAFQVVASPRIRVLDGTSGLLLIEPLDAAEALCPSARGGRDEDAEDFWPRG